MPRHSDKPIEQILENPEAASDEPEEVAEVTLPGGIDAENFSPRARDYASDSAIRGARSVQEAREAAHVPPHIPMKDLENKTVVFVHKRQQKAALPNSGELRDGYFCLCVDADTDAEFTTWVGQTVLFRELTLLELPFKTTITKRGRTYFFN